ncbi:DUF2326 domain-containing protein [Exiguobacterium sp. BRG2]|uniref:DUF2326 domain-containing protein n=1 Tax=Exiguobacterium sp. BRG2 TaxID=2962584 RepID=UPI002882B9F5|nr:DUF2326 domain-containing protein [Exiguobacterium sp. BRG2]MDT0172898.1 DUF2326 domain-containing protein [Exiguobacterium sp. BRG2]
MHRRVNRIKINKLYSDPEVFNPIIFHDGVNIILGEKSDSKTVRGRKTNGVGKSLSIEFLNFCLLKKYKDSRVSLIPDNILGSSVNLMLDIEIGQTKLTLIRNKQNQEKPSIKKNSKLINFENLDDAQAFLKDLTFIDLKSEPVPSFRSLISPLIRDERSEFKDILECFDVSKKILIDLTPHLYFLDISLDVYKKTNETVKKIEEKKTIAKNTKKEVTDGNQKKISEVKAELNSLDDELSKINEAIESFKSNEAFNTIEKDLIQLEDLLDTLRKKQKAIKYEYNKIKTLPKPERIDNNEIEILYNQFKKGLGEVVVRSLEEAIIFKSKVGEFQNTLVNQRALELQEELNEITEEIRNLDDKYSEKLRVFDQKGVLKNLKVSLKIYDQKNTEFAKLKALYNEYESAIKDKKTLMLKKSNEILELDDLIESNSNLLDSFLSTLLNVHDFIMGNKECSFTVETVNKNTTKKIIEIEMRIFDDGSHSVDRTKVFIYDMALLFNEYTRKRHPSFLIHDNIFDVDQDTLVQSLNFLADRETKHLDFQYIITLNRDKIENEEKLNIINLDIESHKVASFTKETKFLHRDYQEK